MVMDSVIESEGCYGTGQRYLQGIKALASVHMTIDSILLVLARVSSCVRVRIMIPTQRIGGPSDDASRSMTENFTVT